MSFTPGPWFADEMVTGQLIGITADAREGKAPIAAVEVGFDSPFEDEQLANLELITAAPDLYAALLLAFELIQNEPTEVVATCYAAICKARGLPA